jgi:hypothetical protein
MLASHATRPSAAGDRRAFADALSAALARDGRAEGVAAVSIGADLETGVAVDATGALGTDDREPLVDANNAITRTATNSHGIARFIAASLAGLAPCPNRPSPSGPTRPRGLSTAFLAS